jgi:hypothetical protein
MDPLALPPADAAGYIGLRRRALSRLISAGKIEACKDGGRTLVDVANLRAYYLNLRKVDGSTPLACLPRAPAPRRRPRSRRRP